MRSDSARPETASPSSESTAGDSDDWRLTLKGGLPPLAYVGDTETLWEKYPRLEMAWILDRDYHDDDARVVWEFVLDTSNQLYWRDLRDPGTSSPGFTYAIRNHVITDRVHVREPQSLRIWQHHARICDVAGLPTTTANRIRWGYYRHRVEAYRLQKAVQVFRQAQEAGRIQFKPHQHSYLQIEWRTDRTGEPQIGKVLFHRASESPAELLP